MKDASPRLDALVVALNAQAASCHDLGSPFTASICEALVRSLSDRSAVDLAKSTPARDLIKRLQSWPGNPNAAHDSVPLRLAGSLHALVRRGAAPTLAALYPPAQPPSIDALAKRSFDTLLDHAPFINDWLNSPPQTNEVGRSAVLGAGLVALERSLPGLGWRVLELGASAGLNLLADCYALDLSGHFLGDPDSAVQLKPVWQGDALPPQPALPRIESRAGCDLNPLDVSDPNSQERLLAYIWADQQHRLERTQAAVEMISETPMTLHQTGADAFLQKQLAHLKSPTLVMHSVAWQYFPADVKAACRAIIANAAQKATPITPLAWLGMEADGTRGSAGLRLKIWPSTEEKGASRLLARVDYHGRWIEWLDDRGRQTIDPGGS